MQSTPFNNALEMHNMPSGNRTKEYLNGIDLLAAMAATDSPQDSSSPSSFHSGTSTPATTILDSDGTPKIFHVEIEDVPATFIDRVSNIPLVSSISQLYTSTKENSQFVKYSVETMETSVKYVCQPVLNNLDLTKLDSFACRQLDKLERNYPAILEPPNRMIQSAVGLYKQPKDLSVTLDFLQSSQQRIDSLINQLRMVVAEAQVVIHSKVGEWTEYVAQQQRNTLNGVYKLVQEMKVEVVQILRNLVMMLSETAQAMPEAIKGMIRGFILSLPERWNSITSGSFYTHLSIEEAPAFLSQAHQVLSLANESMIIFQSIFNLLSPYKGKSNKNE